MVKKNVYLPKKVVIYVWPFFELLKVYFIFFMFKVNNDFQQVCDLSKRILFLEQINKKLEDELKKERENNKEISKQVIIILIFKIIETEFCKVCDHVFSNLMARIF